jgi:hypothetical protein
MITFCIAFYESYLSTQQTYLLLRNRQISALAVYDGEIIFRRGRLFLKLKF